MSMSEKRTILSRPRTRVYDCNYNAGEKYYKPMVDQLDRKYSTSTSFPFSTFSPPIFNNRTRDEEDDDFGVSARRPPPFTIDMEPSFDRSRRLNAETRSLEEDLEDEIATSMGKLKVIRANKAASVEKESSSFNGSLNGFSKHKKLNLVEKFLDSVGVNGKLADTPEDEILKRSTIRMPTMFDDDTTSNGLIKWTTLRESSLNDGAEHSAAARIRQTRARLADIENEMEAVTQKGLAREKHLPNLKSLIAGEDPFIEILNSSSRSDRIRLAKTLKKSHFDCTAGSAT